MWTHHIWCNSCNTVVVVVHISVLIYWRLLNWWQYLNSKGNENELQNVSIYCAHMIIILIIITLTAIYCAAMNGTMAQHSSIHSTFGPQFGETNTNDQWPLSMNIYIYIYVCVRKKNIQTIQLLTISIHTIQIQYNIRKVYVIIFVMAITRQPYTHNYHVYIYTYRHVVWFNNVLNRFNCHWLIGQIETDHSAGQPWIIIIIIMNKWCASPFLLCYNN